jgi:hypothetical protein
MPAEMSLIEGVYRHRLVESATSLVDDAEQGQLARAAIETCRRIEADLTAEVARLRPVLADGGIEIEGVEPIADRQNHTITFLVADAETGEAAVDVLGPHGYVRWERWTGGALESFRRSAEQCTTARSGGVTTVVRFRWRPRRRRGMVDRLVKPTAGDWSLVQLPTWAWWAYPLVRVGRQTVERLGLRPKHRASLGPFLATPDSLLDPLFEHVGVTSDDVLMDLGAGDGRVVGAATERYGCLAMGVEHDPDLVAAARRRIANAGIEDRAEVVLGDARTANVSAASVIVIFLPIDVVADLFDGLVARLAPGTRVLVHEQSRLPDTLHPDSSTVIVGHDAVTVAHVWTIASTDDG